MSHTFCEQTALINYSTNEFSSNDLSSRKQETRHIGCVSGFIWQQPRKGKETN